MVTPPLVKAALAQVQFETIDPFLDGNGRVGRLLVVLQLAADGLQREPLLYVSLHFKERLGIVRELTSRRRGRVFSYARYVGILSGGMELPR